jgi:hypothetical protein
LIRRGSSRAETEENVQYFERYGFVNYGVLGEKNEFMMVFSNH